ncbi:hypothetical protein RhiirA1_479749 [Rhizophagus irregularis]|uniref:Uncharacterized protein n=1 Tax=Rhizophagus irregularis TaxID=588596 RepID=A0A2N0QQ76_9GLOM|nr:hypothetical protein RhiirA1_479749 [Rhizophagus irregularis]
MGLRHFQFPRDHGCCYGTNCQLPRQGRSRTHDPVAKLKEWFNVNQPPRRSNSNAANTRSHSRSRSKSKDRSASTSRRDNNNSYNHNNNANNHNKPNPNTSQRARHNSKERSVSFSSSSRSTALANFHKRISALELADQRMTRIKSHLGLDPLPTPNEPDLDLMQEDTPVSHVPLNIQSSAKSTSPPRSILTRPSPPTTIVPKVACLNLFKILRLVSSIGGAPLDQADSASSV